jgi:alkanesulfonate monooxygenase SsuD/methylene tetrahydromethanopterin reductase-like flavin-dependent oxidoreductase (luciferase family)/predicted kinase
VSALPEPALIVLVGASGSGKSTWAGRHYRAAEIVSSDDLRGIVGSGRHDLDATDDAFRLLDDIVGARARRGLTCVIDTLGLDPVRRRGYLELARRARLPAVAVRFWVPPPLARQRNAGRDRPVPAPVLTAQLRRAAEVALELADEGWDEVVLVRSDEPDAPASGSPMPPAATVPATSSFGSQRALFADPSAERPQFVLQVSRFPWGEDPAGWLGDVAAAAAEAGFAGLALMDHLIQIPQVDRAWAPIPEPWVTLGLLAGLPTGLHLGSLVSPVTFRPPGILAKTVATLDVLSGGRAFLGLGAGWWGREHAGFGLPFPPAGARLDALEAAIETVRALWSPGTKAYAGERVHLAETTCYPRPVGAVPIIVGGGGARTLRIAARLADAGNVRSDPDTLPDRIKLLRQHCAEAGRDPAEVAVTVLDLPLVGRDRDEVWRRVEAHRGRTPAAAFGRTHFAGRPDEHRARYAELAAAGVRTVFVSPVHFTGAADVLDLAPALA